MAKRNRRGFWVTTILLLLLVSVLLFMFLNNKEEEAIEVKTELVSKRTIVQTVSAIGKLKPQTEVKITPELSGELVSLNIKEGDSISYGQVLARIKPDIIETQLAQSNAGVDASRTEIEFAKSALKRATLDFERVNELYTKKYISKQEFDAAKAQLDQSKANVESAEARLKQSEASLNQIKRSADRTTIYSPINGIVTKLLVEKGEKVLGTQQFQGTELMRVADLNEMNAVVDVDENDIVLVSVGDTALVEIDAITGKKYKGIVLEIGHSAKEGLAGTQDQVTNFEVKIRMLEIDRKFRPGMNCNVEIMTETKADVIAVPLQSVTVRAEDLNTTPDVNESSGPVDKTEEKVKDKPKSVVFLYEKNKAKMVSVETGISDNGYIEIMKGLKEKDEVIIGNFAAVSKLLTDGAKVKMDTTGNSSMINDKKK